jgi:hypothetical protein
MLAPLRSARPVAVLSGVGKIGSRGQSSCAAGPCPKRTHLRPMVHGAGALSLESLTWLASSWPNFDQEDKTLAFEGLRLPVQRDFCPTYPCTGSLEPSAKAKPAVQQGTRRRVGQ